MTNAFPYSLVESGGRKTITAFNVEAQQPVFIATDTNPYFEAIRDGLDSGDPEVWSLFDVGSGIAKKFNQITDRVSFDGRNILWDGDEVHSVLAEQLTRAIEDGNPENYVALAKFWEKLESNPNEHSREQAYDFLASHAFQITPEGDVVGYKGVSQGYDKKGEYHSSWASQVPGKPSAFVNGSPVPPLSHVPQKVGDTVTMPRSEVAHDPSKACERGLHVATRSYAGSYGTVLEVHVNPRDIVSVPTDAHGAKVRVCRYQVARVASENQSTSPVLRSEDKNSWAGDVGYKVH